MPAIRAAAELEEGGPLRIAFLDTVPADGAGLEAHVGSVGIHGVVAGLVLGAEGRVLVSHGRSAGRATDTGGLHRQ